MVAAMGLDDAVVRGNADKGSWREGSGDTLWLPGMRVGVRETDPRAETN